MKIDVLNKEKLGKKENIKKTQVQNEKFSYYILSGGKPLTEWFGL